MHHNWPWRVKSKKKFRKVCFLIKSWKSVFLQIVNEKMCTLILKLLDELCAEATVHTIKKFLFEYDTFWIRYFEKPCFLCYTADRFDYHHLWENHVLKNEFEPTCKVQNIGNMTFKIASFCFAPFLSFQNGVCSYFWIQFEKKTTHKALFVWDVVCQLQFVKWDNFLHPLFPRGWRVRMNVHSLWHFRIGFAGYYPSTENIRNI